MVSSLGVVTKDPMTLSMAPAVSAYDTLLN